MAVNPLKLLQDPNQFLILFRVGVPASAVPTWHKLESREEGTSVEKIPPLDWPVGEPMVHFLDK